MATAAARVLIYGHVQGVFFRAFAQAKASALGLTGYTRNLSDGSVEVWAEGEKPEIEALIDDLKVGPPRARVSEVTADWVKPTGQYNKFSVR